MSKDLKVEDIYQRVTQVEHILIRPDSYVGSIESTSAQHWILCEGDNKFTQKNIEYVPGLYKIFDEILVNAADNYHRDTSMSTIKVTIDKERNVISVWNDGQGIPVQMHQTEKMLVPELIFGHLLTSSNYDDTKKKVTGGRNGYGAKLTNIFSKKFTVETADSKNRKSFKMIWTNNMSSASEADVKFYSGEDYTCITFEPDLKKFGMSILTEDMVSLMRKRVYDLAGVIQGSVKVFLNGVKVPCKGFSSYTDMYLKNLDTQEPLKLSDKTTKNERWDVIVSQSDGEFQQVSFVNSICTSRGGTHVAYICDQIVEKIQEAIKKKHKDLNPKPAQIKNHLWIFINSLIDNPTFDSQTKETLTLKASQFGSKCELSEKFIKDILKSPIIDAIILQAKAKEHQKLAKTLQASKKSRLLGIPKLEDANDAGTKYAEDCTLILTEGDSAKQLAMAGIEVVGRDKFGVFPLKGKLLNVRDASIKQIMENQEIQNLIKILGLQVNKKYDNVKQLRYGSIMIMSDQDQDGSHIKGLIINFFHHFWPSLVQNNGFMREFVTPLIKATRNNQVMSFFTINDFKNWAQGVDLKKWKIKYYKGLGTSTDKEGKEYFQNITKHKITFKYVDRADDEAIDLAFNKKKADNRKEWLNEFDPDNFVDHNQKHLRYVDFVNQELIQFSHADNIRSIPSICDGLKPGQRKILYACFKRNLKAEIKVAQLAGYVAEHSAYHHGEASLSQTIVGMAQDFVGANNINLLMPIGQFGSRNMGGKEAASSRYIYTNLSKLTRNLFNENDDHLYKYTEDDGQSVEPEWYLPIIPMVLVNGAEGIGTGWSTNVPCYNPRDLIEAIRGRIQGHEFESLMPWFRGYNGRIEPTNKGNFTTTGMYEMLDECTLRITELPIKKWTREYKNFLEGLLEPEQGEPEIEDIKEYHSNNTVDFLIRLPPGKLEDISRSEGIEKKFKLTGSVSTSNMVLFDHHGKLRKYNDTTEILEEFFSLRMSFYQKRKDYLLSRLLRDLEILENKKRFILAVINEEIKVRNVKKAVLVKELHQKGFRQMKDMNKIRSTKMDSEVFEERMENEDENPIENFAKEYNYLLIMPLWSLTFEKVEDLIREHQKKSQEFEELTNTTIQTIYTRDLDELEKVYAETIEAETSKGAVRASKSQMMKAISGKPSKPKKKKKVASDSEESDNGSDDDSDDDFKSKKTKTKELKKKASIKDEKRLTNSLSAALSDNEGKWSKNEPSFSSQPLPWKKDENEKEKAPRKKKETKKSDPGKENKMEEEIPNKSKSHDSDEKKQKKFDFSNSILQYLSKSTKTQTTNQIKEKKNDENAGLTLAERIKLREQQGDLKAFTDTYVTFKRSPTKALTEFAIVTDENSNGKRRSDVNLDKKLNKKMKIDQSEESDEEDELAFSLLKSFSSQPLQDVTSNQVNRPKRSSVANRKLVLSDDEVGRESGDEEFMLE